VEGLCLSTGKAPDRVVAVQRLRAPLTSVDPVHRHPGRKRLVSQLPTSFKSAHLSHWEAPKLLHCCRGEEQHSCLALATHGLESTTHERAFVATVQMN
jgi:hypothetical protein